MKLFRLGRVWTLNRPLTQAPTYTGMLLLDGSWVTIRVAGKNDVTLPVHRVYHIEWD